MTSAGVFVDETDTNCSNKAGLYTIVVTAQKDCNFITTGCTKDTYNTFDIKITWDSFVRSGKTSWSLYMAFNKKGFTIVELMIAIAILQL